MDVIFLVLLGGALGVALSTQLTRQPPHVMVIQVEPEEMRSGGGCAPIFFGIMLVLVLLWVVSSFSQL